jgi:hypothetical protein
VDRHLFIIGWVYLAIAKKPPPTSVARMIKDPIELLQNGGYSGFSNEFLSAIDKGLAVRPEDRPQSIEEFRNLLQLELSVPGQPNSTVIPALPGFPAGIVGTKPGKPEFSSSMDDSADVSDAVRTAPRKTFARVAALWIAVALCLAGTVGYLSLGPKTIAAVRPVAGPADASSRTTEQVLLSSSSAVTQDAPQLTTSPSATVEIAAPSKASIVTPTKSPSPGSSSIRATGTVQLNIKPWGTVSVDGISKGVSPPLKKLTLTEGRHTIKITNPNFSSRTIEIDISKNRTDNIEYDFSPLYK